MQGWAVGDGRAPRQPGSQIVELCSTGQPRAAAIHSANCGMWLNRIMFARKICVQYEVEGRRVDCPLKWLDSFSMRSFTNASVFDDTLPISDGQMEIGSNVPLDQLREAMEDWFRRKGYLAKDSKLSLAQN